jgi:hypothetical protein
MHITKPFSRHIPLRHHYDTIESFGHNTVVAGFKSTSNVADVRPMISATSQAKKTEIRTVNVHYARTQSFCERSTS